MKKLNTQSPDFQAELKALLAFEAAQNPEIDRIVADICADVQKRGDAALIEYTNRFDGTAAQTIADLILTQDDLQAAFERLQPEIQTALKNRRRTGRKLPPTPKKWNRGPTKTKTARCWDNRLHRLTASAFTSPAAKRRIRVPSS